MKALSWREPFASLMMCGKIETRTWKTNYRGWVLICASQKKHTEGTIISISGEIQSQRILSLINRGKLKENPGFAIAIGELVDCRPMCKSDEETCFVKYNPELWCHVYRHVREIVPFKWKGQLGFKNLSQTDLNRIKFK